MRIDLNGQTLATAATTLSALVEEQGLDAASVATALDGSFVPRTLRAAAALRDGAKVEILTPMQGG